MKKEAFIHYEGTYRNTVYRVALNMLKNPSDADDAAQEVFLRLYAANKRFTDDEHVKSWLIRVCINHCRNLLKSPWRTRRAEMQADYPDDPPVFDTLEQREMYNVVMSLPAKDRTILYLFYYEDYPVRRIAELLSIQETAVTTRLSRARQRLKRALIEEAKT